MDKKLWRNRLNYHAFLRETGDENLTVLVFDALDTANEYSNTWTVREGDQVLQATWRLSDALNLGLDSSDEAEVRGSLATLTAWRLAR